MTDATPAFIPAGVQAMMDRLREATGVEPTAESLLAGRWRITVANARVVMTYTGRAVHRNGFKPHSSTLTLDGENVPVQETFWDFVRFFRDPDADLAPVVPAPMPPAADVRTAPAVVQEYYRRWLRRFRTGPKPRIQVGRQDDRWTIGVESPRVSLRLHFSPAEDGRTELEVQLVMDGADHSYELGMEYGGNFDKALRYALEKLAQRITPGSASAPAPAQAIAAEAPAARNTSVDARRGAVWRI